MRKLSDNLLGDRMRHGVATADITVIGGGSSGGCAAIAAPRLDRAVAPVQDLPVFGRSSSFALRAWVGGANSIGHDRYARETGTGGEFLPARRSPASPVAGRAH